MNNSNGAYGEEIWEKKIKEQNEVSVIFGNVCNINDVKMETKEFMSKIDKMVLPLKKGSKIVDLGVGPMARFSIEFAKRGYSVTGVDISDTTLKLASRYIKKENVKIDLKKANITNIDVLKEKYDVVFCRATFYHIPIHLTLLSLINIRKIIKKNGIFIIEFGLKENLNLTQKIKEGLYFAGHYFKRFMGRGFRVNVSRFTREEIRDLIDKSGFETLYMIDRTTYVLKKK